jgi:hypothetical protein
MSGTANVLRRTFCFLSQQTLLNYLQNSFFFVSRQQTPLTLFIATKVNSSEFFSRAGDDPQSNLRTVSQGNEQRENSSAGEAENSCNALAIYRRCNKV